MRSENFVNDECRFSEIVSTASGGSPPRSSGDVLGGVKLWIPFVLKVGGRSFYNIFETPLKPLGMDLHLQ